MGKGLVQEIRRVIMQSSTEFFITPKPHLRPKSQLSSLRAVFRVLEVMLFFSPKKRKRYLTSNSWEQKSHFHKELLWEEGNDISPVW